MAKLTSHTLNGIDGSHASFIPVLLEHVKSKKVIFDDKMDNEGRLSVEIDPSDLISEDTYQLVFNVSDYWKERNLFHSEMLNEIIIRFTVNDIDGTYHIPVIMSPNSYSVWKSS
jgi:5-hydroxyisourate hydrolase